MNPQEYTITEVLSTGKPWKNGISYYDIIVDSRPKPLSIGKKQPPQVGWTIYGIVTEEPGQLADKFKAVQRDEQTAPQVQYSSTGVPFTIRKVSDDPRQESIERQCALKTAGKVIAKLELPDEPITPTYILNVANIFVAWIKDGTMPGVERQEGDETPAKEELRKTVEGLKGGTVTVDTKGRPLVEVLRGGDPIPDESDLTDLEQALPLDDPGFTDDDYQG